MTSHLRAFLGRTWFYLALAVTFFVGWVSPATGFWIKEAGLTPYLVGLAFFINGFTLSTTALLGSLRRWPLLAVAMIVVFLLPAGLVFAMRALLPGGDTPLAAGFQLLAVIPTTLVSAVVLTRVAGGNGALALYITVLANMLAIIVVPALMRLTLDMTGVRLNVLETSLSLVYTVLLPTLGGQLARRFFRIWAVQYARPLGIVAQLTILLFIVTGLAALPRRELSPTLWTGVLVGSLLLHLLLLVAAAISARLLRGDAPARRALVLGTAQKSLAVATFLWERLLLPLGPAYGIAMLPCIVYYVIQLIIDSALAQWWGHRAREAERVAATSNHA